jgi:hypothetical protein
LKYCAHHYSWWLSAIEMPPIATSYGQANIFIWQRWVTFILTTYNLPNFEGWFSGNQLSLSSILLCYSQHYLPSICANLCMSHLRLLLSQLSLSWHEIWCSVKLMFVFPRTIAFFPSANCKQLTVQLNATFDERAPTSLFSLSLALERTAVWTFVIPADTPLTDLVCVYTIFRLEKRLF